MPIDCVPDDVPPGSFLLHCRPRISFHLGHLKMLNVMYALLSQGHQVIMQIVPYDEHEPRNRTLRVRLTEESEITREFYRSYLGFDSPQLTIVNTSDQEIEHSRLQAIQRLYARLYQEGEPAITRLIEQHRRVWASPNILFVPKCIASIEILAPDYLVCGEKHEIISEGFTTLLREDGHTIPSYKFADFKDLYFETAMDRVDSVYTCIDVNDNEDFVLHKLSMLRSLPGLKSKWLDHFVEHILDPAPERIKDGLGRALRSEAEQEIAVVRFLANVRSLIPYSLEEEVEINLNWASSLFSSFTRAQKQQIARVAKQLFRDSGSSDITIQRLFGTGKSGSMVLEVREHEDESNRVSNVSILKIGQEHEIKLEKANYEKFVRPRKTAAFMSVKPGAATVDGTAGIAYQDAQHYLGISVKDRVDTIAAAFDGEQFDVREAQSALHEVLGAHLHEVLYKHGAHVEAGGISRYLNEFLPAEYRVEVDTLDRTTGTLGIASVPLVSTLFQGDVDIAEVRPRERTALAYAVGSGSKVELALGGKDELLLGAVKRGRRIAVEGKIVSTRREFYDQLYTRLSISRDVSEISLSNGLRIPDPVARLDDVLSREYYDYVVSSVHGDLHSGNVLYGHGKIGIIDYGKMRASFPALYDAAFLCADLKSHYLAEHFDLSSISRLEQALGRRTFMAGLGRQRAALQRLDVFEYHTFPAEIRSLGPAHLYYGLLMAVHIGRLKFDLPETEKRVGLLLAHSAYLRTR